MGVQSPTASPPQPSTPRLAVLGTGRAGRDVIAMLDSAGAGVDLVWNRSPMQAAGAHEVLHGTLPDLRGLDAVIITVSDGAIAAVARSLSGRIDPPTVLLHISGALPGSCLSAAGSDLATGSMHPLQTLVGDGAPASPFPWILEGDPPAVALAATLVEAMGCASYRIVAADKARYHLAATVASNLLLALVDLARRQAQRAGLPASELPGLLLPLMRATLDNSGRLGPAAALTGPIRRGDLATLEAHLQQLITSPRQLDAYTALSRIAVDLAVEGGLERDRANDLLETIDRAVVCLPQDDD